MNYHNQLEEHFDPTKQQFVNHGYSSQGIHGQVPLAYGGGAGHHPNFQQQLQQM